MANKNQGLVFVVIAALLLSYTGAFDGLFTTQQVGGDVTPPETAIIEVCESTTTPSVTFSGHNKYSGASVSGNIVYKIASYIGTVGNDAWAPYDGIQTTTLGTAIAASPKDKILYIADAGSYHNVSDVLIVPCREVIPRSIEMVGFDTSLNYTFLKNEDDTANTNAAQQAITSGQSKKIRSKIESGADVGGDYYMVVQYNSSEYLKPEVPALESITTPDHVTVDDTSYKTVSYNLGELEDNGGKEFTFVIEAQGSKNPSTDLIVNIYSRANYIDEAGGRAFLYGAEDEEDTRIGDQTDLEFVISLS